MSGRGELTEGEVTMTNLTDLFADIPSDLPEELFQTLLPTSSFRIERIVSPGHSSPEGFLYDQETDEWVLLLAGALRVRGPGGGLRRAGFRGRPARDVG
jgi:hypothetical protein